MKSLRWMFLVVLVVSLMSFTGCLNKTYFFDFTREEDLERADGDWIAFSADWYELSGDGLAMWNNQISAPLGFKGAMTMIIMFELNVDMDTTANLEILLATDINFNDPCMGIDIYNLGSEDEYCGIFKHGVELYDRITPIPVLHRSGYNEFRLMKTGNLLKFWLNGVTLMADVPIVDYPSDVFSPHIYMSQPFDSDALFVRSIRVKYGETAVIL